MSENWMRLTQLCVVGMEKTMISFECANRQRVLIFSNDPLTTLRKVILFEATTIPFISDKCHAQNRSEQFPGRDQRDRSGYQPPDCPQSHPQKPAYFAGGSLPAVRIAAQHCLGHHGTVDRRAVG